MLGFYIIKHKQRDKICENRQNHIADTGGTDMSGKKKIGIAVGSLLAVVLAALGIYKVFFAPKGYTQNLTDPALGGTVVADYTKDESARTETFA